MRFVDMTTYKHRKYCGAKENEPRNLYIIPNNKGNLMYCFCFYILFIMFQYIYFILYIAHQFNMLEFKVFCFILILCY